MIFIPRSTFILLMVFFSATMGCSAEKRLLSSEADQAFFKIVKEEQGNTSVVVKTVGETLWIYVPGEQTLFHSVAGNPINKPPKRELSLEYIDGNFKENTFTVEYDIVSVTRSQKNNGISSASSDDFTKKYVKVFNALKQTYLSLEKIPTFIVIIFADIKNGIEISYTYHGQDLFQSQNGTLPPDESKLRILSDWSGNQDIVNDKEGKHLKCYDIPWSEFLSKQITNRIGIKYQQSDFPPGPETEKEMLSIIASTLKTYEFTDFKFIKLNDLRSGTTNSYGKAALEENLKTTQ